MSRIPDGFRVSLALGVVLLFGLPSGGSIAGPRWSTLFVSPDGSDSSPCTRKIPCASFGRAYRVAQPGQVVRVTAGSYPAQRIDADPAKTSGDDVVFRPAAGAAVTVERIALGQVLGRHGASHVTIRDVAVATTISAWHATDITFERIDARNFYLNSVQDVLIKGGDYGPCTSSVDPCSNSKIDLSLAAFPNRNITIDGAVFHDYRIGNPSDHFECLIVFSGVDITIRNSKFLNCEFFDILLQDHRADPFDRPLTNVLIENNWFDMPWDGRGKKSRATAVAFSLATAGINNVLVRFNSFHPGTGLVENISGTSTAFTNFRVVGNLLGSTNICFAGATYAYNLRVASPPCNRTEARVDSFGYANASGRGRFDAHLVAGSPAIGFVTATGGDYRLAADIDRQTRSAPRDAGSDRPS